MVYTTISKSKTDLVYDINNKVTVGLLEAYEARLMTRSS
jgi:hypothetical protein